MPTRPRLNPFLWANPWGSYPLSMSWSPRAAPLAFWTEPSLGMPFTKSMHPGTWDSPDLPWKLHTLWACGPGLAALFQGNRLYGVSFLSLLPAWGVCLHPLAGWVMPSIRHDRYPSLLVPRPRCPGVRRTVTGVHLATQCSRLCLRSIWNDKHRHLSYRVNELVMSNPLDCPGIDLSQAPPKRLCTAV